HTVITTDGAVTTDSYSSYVYSHQTIGGGCNALVQTTRTERTETQDNRCTGSANTTFGVSAVTGTGGETPCGCTSSNRRNIQRTSQRTLTYDRVVTTIDGGSSTTTYDVIKSQTFSPLTSCGPSHSSGTANTGNSSPQPAGYPQVNNTGATVTTADFTLPVG